MRLVYRLMVDGQWRTLAEIAEATGAPEASVSARLRDLRKRKFGGHVVARRPRGDRALGLFEYQLVKPLVQLDLFGGNQ
jgi:DNA-binding Lrp family transcriptional regulator